MAEADIYTIATEAPVARAGEKLRRARERAGIDLAALAAWTRINERHLVALEEGDYAALPGRVYAVAFSRTYASTVGLDGDAIAREVREELNRQSSVTDRPSHHLEIEDPAKIPSARLAWAAGLLAVGLVAGLGVYWSSYLTPAAELPPVVAERQSTVPAAPELSPSAQISPTAESAVAVAAANGPLASAAAPGAAQSPARGPDGRPPVAAVPAQPAPAPAPAAANPPAAVPAADAAPPAMPMSVPSAAPSQELSPAPQ